MCGLPYHSLLRKLLDLLDGPRSPLLESHTMQLLNPSAFSPSIKILHRTALGSDARWTYSLVEVDGVLAGHDLLDGRLGGGLLSFRRHF